MSDNRWDLTTRKRISKKQRIIKCPVCGRYGQVKFYTGPSKTEKFAGSVDHKGHIELGMFNMIDDSCVLNEAEVQAATDLLKQ